MNLKQALKRIEALEARVRELEARPPYQIHYHYEQPQPQYYPQIPTYPVCPWTPTWMGAAGPQLTAAPAQ